MGARLVTALDAVRASYWFVPGLMALAAVGLAALTTAAEDWAAELPLFRTWLALNTPEGARAVLSTIAGSLIGVAGVSFSIIIAALAYATSQLGPRLLRNFMRDRGNQFVLGVFIAAFIYGLLILRTVSAGLEDGRPFVPHLGVAVALLLALAGVGVFIYFIHHAPKSIQASELIAEIGEELRSRALALFPRRIGEPTEPEPAWPDAPALEARAAASGYVLRVDGNGLLALASERDLAIRLLARPGDFVAEGDPVALVQGGASHDALRRVSRAFVAGRARTQTQDLLFAVQQIVEIAARALSPGVNDPYTAVACLDWLGAGLIALGERARPAEARRDGDGLPRLWAPALSFEEATDAAFTPLRAYAATDPVAAPQLIATLARVHARVPHPPYRAALRQQAEALLEEAEAAGAPPRLLERLKEAAAALAG
jgi:uncharacterized membrane protein